MSVAEILAAARRRDRILPRDAGTQTSHINIEFKARCNNPEAVRKTLGHMAVFKGRDHQIDTYFNVPHGRMKLREGNIEHSLVFYDRSDGAAAKQSKVTLLHDPPEEMKNFLVASLGVKVVVDKQREIYFIGNVKVHLDTVDGLHGNFIEVEAIDEDGTLGVEKLRKQCDYYQEMFEVHQSDLLTDSYSDMLHR